MLKINKSNYEFYKEVFKIIWEFLAKQSDIDPNIKTSPITVLENWEKESESIAIKGLKEGLRDAIIWIKDFPPNLLIELNDDLISRNYPSLIILASKIRNTPKKVLDRGKIKNLDEYFVIKEVLNDLEYEISESQRNELEILYSDFELSKTKKNAS